MSIRYPGENTLSKIFNLMKSALTVKVDKVEGKGLSTNDYTDAEKSKLSGVEEGANKTVVDKALSSTSTNPVQNKAIYEALQNVRSNAVQVTSEITAEATSVNIPDSISSMTYFIIYCNGILLVPNVHYTISDNVVSLVGFTAHVGDLFTFLAIGENPINLDGKQDKITASGILKGDGAGGVSAAVKGTDYFTPSDVNEIAAEAAKKVDISGKLDKTGDTMTGKLTVPQVETGADNSNFFQCRKFRGEGDANTYYHAIDFGYRNHDQVDFHEYGGKWNFYKNQSGKVNEGVLCGSITSNGWEGHAKLQSGSTMVTSQLTENSDVIATTAFVRGLIDMAKPKQVSVTLSASGWNANTKTQTASVSGVTETANCIVTAAPDSYMAYAEAGVRCTAQGTGTLTFACETAPTEDVVANVLILG